jgi:hypothetical protein
MRRAAAGVATVGATAVVVLSGAPAHAAPSSCPDGVAVVVDPGPLGGAPGTGCVAGAGGLTAAEVVQRAGFEVEYAAGQPFVCRVDGAPGPQQESCSRTPPADAYWGLFWSAGAGEAWSYSTLGAAALEVPDGGAVGLRFQDGGERDEPRVDTAGSRPSDAEDAGTAAGTAAEPAGGSTPALTLVAGGAVVVLVAAAAAVAWRRRG